MARKIPRADVKPGPRVTRLFVTMSVASLPGILAVVAALMGALTWLWAIPIFIVSVAVGWVIIIRAMIEMGMIGPSKKRA